MAQVQPILPHVAITMPLPEAEGIADALDMIGAILGDDVPEALTTFAAQLMSAVEQLNNVLTADAAESDDDLAASA